MNATWVEKSRLTAIQKTDLCFLLILKVQHLDFNLQAKKITDVLRARIKTKHCFDKLEKLAELGSYSTEKHGMFDMNKT